MSRLVPSVLAATAVLTLHASAAADDNEQRDAVDGQADASSAPSSAESPALSARKRSRTEGDSEAEGPLTKRQQRKADRDAQIAEERKKPWMRRWEPQRHLVEVGGYGGIFMPSTEHDLYDPATAPPDPFWSVGGEAGLRAAYFPIKPLGIEAEFGANLLRQRNITNDPVFVYGFRGHAILQMPMFRVVPFLLGGYGLLGVRSQLVILGSDVDPAFHYGGGVKLNIVRWLSARVEARQIVTASEARADSGTFHFQALAGLSVTLNRRLPKVPPPPPLPINPDRDNDGLLNEVDECPDDAGLAPTGCPDSDGDSFIDRVDACPEVPGVAPDGCPMKDTDNDTIADLHDQCVFQPETFNNNADEDGCPDDLPPKLVALQDELRGIEFDFNKDTIRPTSTRVLDAAVAAMTEFPLVKVRIVGHTDNVGKPELNLELSKRRAAAVKKYLTDKGVDGARIVADGSGDTQPVATNETEAGRAKNRRIEFEITENPQMEVPAAEQP
ncbi:MAG: OmpA family protein [Nannocystaceae bacterium]|nr:OmpA family protein [Nannocystaceae bacterium]